MKAAVTVLVVLLVSASPSSAQDEEEGNQQQAPPPARIERNAGSDTEQTGLDTEQTGSYTDQPDASGPDPSRPPSLAKKAVSLSLILAGAAAVVVGDPDYTPSQFIPGNYPSRVDIRDYLPHGNYPGHTYRLQRQRGPRYGHRWSCRHPSCPITDEQLYDNYINGYTDGYDDGFFSGRVESHREGWVQGYSRGQAEVIRIMNAEGLVVYDGPFDPASYVGDTFEEKKQWRYTGVALVVAGAVLNLLPERTGRIQGSLLHGGGQISAAFGW